MTMRAITLLAALLQIGFPNLLAIEDVAVVTGLQGYLLNERNAVADTVPSGYAFRVKSVDGDYLVVEHFGEDFRLHKKLCQRTSDWRFANKLNGGDIIQALRLLQQSQLAAELENHQKALELLKQAVAVTADDFAEKQLPLRPWMIQFEAHQHYLLEEYEVANVLLDESEAIAAEIGMKKDSFYADILNMRGLVRSAEGKGDEAVELHRRAVEITTATLGKDHVDCGILNDNLSHAYEAIDDLEAAIKCQEIAIDVYKSVYPASAEEVALAHQRLANLRQANEDYEQAISGHEVALRSFVIYHPHLLFEIADTQENLIYCNYQLSNLDAAEKACRNLVQSLRKFTYAEQLPYRKRTCLRLGVIDYELEDYAAALVHYQQAAELSDDDSPDIDDGYMYENAGDALLQLKRFDEAKSAYDEAVDIYTAIEGVDSENLVTVRDSLKQIADGKNAGLDDVVMVAQAEGYLLDDDGKTIAVVPEMTILNWIAAGEEFHEVEFDGKVGRLPNSQLQIKEQIPGYGVVKEKDFRFIVSGLDKFLQALEDKDIETGRAELQILQRHLKNEGLIDTAIDAWAQIQSLQLIAIEDGPQVALRQLDEIRRQVQKLQSAYPLELNINAAEGILKLQSPDSTDVAIERLKEARRIAISHFGEKHSVTAVAASRVGQACFLVNDMGEAALSFAETMRIANEIYPEGSENAAVAANDLAMILFKSERYEEASGVLEKLLSNEQKPPRDQHGLAVTILGSVYARRGMVADGRKLLNTMVDLLRENSEAGLAQPTGVLALTELGRLEVEQKNYKVAVEFLNAAIKANEDIGTSRTFDGSEAHRLLADAYEGLGDVANARSQLNRTLKIYEELGGADSPQSKQLIARLETMSGDRPREPEPLVAGDVDRRQALEDINVAIMHLPISVQMGFLELDRKTLDEALLQSLDNNSSGVAEQTADWALNAHNLLPDLIGRIRQVNALATEKPQLQNYTGWRGMRITRVEPYLAAISQGGFERPESQPSEEERQRLLKLPQDMQDEITRRIEWKTARDVQKKLQAKETMALVRRIGPARGTKGSVQSQYIAWIIPAEGSGRIEVFALGDAELIDGQIDQSLISTYEITEAVENLGEQQAADKQNELFTRLADLIWNRIAIHLPEDTERLALCLDGDLPRIPWAALPITRDGQTLIDRYTIRFLSSPRDLFTLHDSSGLTPPAMIAATDYLIRQDAALAAVPQEEMFFMLDQVRVQDPIIDKDEYLPDTPNEINAIDDLFTKWVRRDRRILSDGTATQMEFLQLERPQALHLSIKNYLKPKVISLDDSFSLSNAKELLPESITKPLDPLQQCGVRLGGRGGATLADGIMTGDEIVSQNLRGTQLVTLSRPAKLQSPPEETRNAHTLLPHVFQLAGARSVVTTIWGEEIDDSANIVLMKAFYQHLADGKAKSDALRAAQLEVRNARKKANGAAHPFFWAGFRITGDQ